MKLPTSHFLLCVLIKPNKQQPSGIRNFEDSSACRTHSMMSIICIAVVTQERKANEIMQVHE